MDSCYTPTKTNVNKKAPKEKTTNLVIENNEPLHDEFPVDSANGNSNSIINKKKWKCPQCTYENWPSALKCTICLTGKGVCNSAVNTKGRPTNNSCHGNSRCGTARSHGGKVAKSRKCGESKVKLTFETCREVDGDGLERSWYSSSSSNEDLNESGVSGLDMVKGKKKNSIADDIYRIGDLLNKNGEFVTVQ